jgi:hypothetical protein
MANKDEQAPRKRGRPKGSKNKATHARRLAARTAGLTPLEYLISIMADENQDQADRVDAAKAAAPYCHSRLQSVTVQEKPYEGDPNELTNEYLASIVAGSRGSDDAPAPKGKRTTH